MNAGLQPAYVLHSRRYNESSLIVEFFTRDFGRIATLAKGVLNSKRTQQSLLQPFIPLIIAYRGRGELPILTTLEPADVVEMPHGKVLYCGMYINELLMRMTARQDPHDVLFNAYTQCMLSLLKSDGSNREIEPVLRNFEVRLLNELGFSLQLKEDQLGNEINPQLEYQYDVLAGPVLSTQSPSSICGDSLLALATGCFETHQQRDEARLLMRQAIRHHLGGQSLKSRELFI